MYLLDKIKLSSLNLENLKHDAAQTSEKHVGLAANLGDLVEMVSHIAARQHRNVLLILQHALTVRLDN